MPQGALAKQKFAEGLDIVTLREAHLIFVSNHERMLPPEQLFVSKAALRPPRTGVIETGQLFEAHLRRSKRPKKECSWRRSQRRMDYGNMEYGVWNMEYEFFCLE